jgi:hypothetical protein
MGLPRPLRVLAMTDCFPLPSGVYRPGCDQRELPDSPAEDLARRVPRKNKSDPCNCDRYIAY